MILAAFIMFCLRTYFMIWFLKKPKNWYCYKVRNAHLLNHVLWSLHFWHFSNICTLIKWSCLKYSFVCFFKYYIRSRYKVEWSVHSKFLRTTNTILPPHLTYHKSISTCFRYYLNRMPLNFYQLINVTNNPSNQSPRKLVEILFAQDIIKPD